MTLLWTNIINLEDIFKQHSGLSGQNNEVILSAHFVNGLWRQISDLLSKDKLEWEFP